MVALAPGPALGNVIVSASGVFCAAMTLALRRQQDGSPVGSIILGDRLAFFIGLSWLSGACNRLKFPVSQPA